MLYKYFYLFLVTHIFLAFFNYCFLFIVYQKINDFLYHLNIGVSFSRICSNTISQTEDDWEKQKLQQNLKQKTYIYFSALYKYSLYTGEMSMYKNVLLKIRNLNCPPEEFEEFQFELYYLSGKIRFRQQQLWKLFLPTNFVFNLVNMLLASTFQTEKIFFAESVTEKTKFITTVINAAIILISIWKLIPLTTP